MTFNHLPIYSEINYGLFSIDEYMLKFHKRDTRTYSVDVVILPLLSSLNMYLPAMQLFYKVTPQPTFTCSKLTIEALE